MYLILSIAIIAPTAGCVTTSSGTEFNPPGFILELVIRNLLGNDEDDDDECPSDFYESYKRKYESYNPYDNVRTAERRKREEKLEKDCEEWLEKHVNQPEAELIQVEFAPNEIEDQPMVPQ